MSLINKLHHPFTAIISGPSSSGKTTLATSIITFKHFIINPTPVHIFVFYNHWQPSFTKLLNRGIVQSFVKGLPTKEAFIKEAEKHKHSLCIIDDGISGMNPDVKLMFTELSHHYNCSIILLVQDLFIGHKDYRTCSYNAKYIFLMKNPRNASQILYLSRQFKPGQSKYVINSYREATKRPYSYLMIDLAQETLEQFRLKSNILPYQFPMKLYIRK